MTLRTAALFDMDKTLVPVNTGSLYVKWRYRRNEARKRDMLRFAAWMAQYAAGVLDPVEAAPRRRQRERRVLADGLAARRGGPAGAGAGRGGKSDCGRRP